jgi:hypothetical protein
VFVAVKFAKPRCVRSGASLLGQIVLPHARSDQSARRRADNRSQRTARQYVAQRTAGCRPYPRVRLRAAHRTARHRRNYCRNCRYPYRYPRDLVHDEIFLFIVDMPRPPEPFNFIVSGREAILKLSHHCRQCDLPSVTLDTSSIETSRVRTR